MNFLRKSEDETLKGLGEGMLEVQNLVPTLTNFGKMAIMMNPKDLKNQKKKTS